MSSASVRIDRFVFRELRIPFKVAFRHAAAERVEKFRTHDAELLKTQYLVYDDDAALMQGAKEAFADLERLFEADTNSETSPRN